MSLAAIKSTAKKDRLKIIPAAYLVLLENNQLLMLRRYNTGYEDGNYSLVAGHLEGNETFRQAIVREAREEAEIILNPDDLEVIHVLHRSKGNINDGERIDIFMTADKWQGDPKNTESHKCDEIGWFLLDDIPDNTIPYIKHALGKIKQKIIYSEFGF